MSTKNIESLTSRTSTQGEGKTKTQGRHQAGFDDHTGVSPHPGMVGKPTTSSGGKSIDLFGADVPDDLMQGTYSEYTKVYEFNYGKNTIEFNSTPGNERIMLRHQSGAGINIGPDGGIIISGSGPRTDKAADYILEVANGQMTYSGNLTLNVTGNLDINVGGEFNVKSSKKTEIVEGHSDITISGDDVKTVDGNQTNLVTGGGALQYLDGLSTIVKGDSRYIVEGPHVEAISGVLTMTAEQEIVLTSPEANIAADNLSVFGDTGTIGGQNIIMYNYNMHTEHTVWSETMNTNVVYGDLEGTAKKAVTADVTNSQNYSDPDPGGGVGSAAGYTVDGTSVDTLATALPTSTLLTDYRTKGSKGVKKVKVDPNNIQKNNINLSNKTGGVTNKGLTNQKVRRKMRDPAHRINAEFTTLMTSLGQLSPEFANISPPNISDIEDTRAIIIQGQTPLGSVTPTMMSKRIKA